MTHTLALVPNVRWIVIEDANEPSSKVANILKNSQHPYAHLYIHREYNDLNHYRGCAQRNLGIAWLRNSFHVYESSIPTPSSKSNTTNHRKSMSQSTFYTQMASHFENKYRKSTNPFQRKSLRSSTNSPVWQDNTYNKNGIVYFADDDNIYDLDLFYQMREIKSVGVWPVAFCGGIYLERPLVVNGKVAEWLVAYDKKRPMATDMAGFAVNLNLFLKNSDVYFDELHNPDGLESNFLRKIVDLQHLEPLANSCTQILVWHTQTKKPILKLESNFRKMYNVSSIQNMEI
ncbi:galactosylgalactosylxylosylprotein 3-beta-glucuronosyltransferase 1-like [Gordionus sp. m RMFG-2023]|uniref:galactosylgalactosylxylosylprotein 3-beta-glucuronosyltransferase 1-like n=1 Tax=Gordionus sp. m RMFG-2023 TaxID=3053472 RepID=UPI0031FBB943